jgi:RNA polymerase sigma-70 factor (ECF subfamily)
MEVIIPGKSMKPGRPGPLPREAEFEEIYRRHSRELWALVYARCLRADLALDISQEAFLRLWRQWENGESIENPRAWLVRVARNLAEDEAKSAFRKNGTSTPESMNALAREMAPPLEKMAHAETLALVRAELGQLPEADRQLLTFRYALDYDAAKIAEILESSVTAIHMRLSRARQRLAERLRAQGVETTL